MDNKSQVKIATTAVQRKLFYNLQKETERLLREYETADPKLIASNLNVPEKDVIEMQKRLASGDVSLDAPLAFEDSHTTRGDLIFDSEESSIDDVLADRQIKNIFTQHVDEFRDQLEGRDREIFDARVLSEEALTLQEVGDRFGITRERARQIEARIIKKLRDFVIEKGTLEI
jgi:RNA polymerase sigma-32 factor